ncbi:unnamed protein product [Aureobasidium vineae]|uniref:Uncharacterized protein n=1 Tax=Aureobasidium vineae TaxID=2773715 RepID=A0A9N8PGL1_9PEZI|nr:unnamed protein product [Aureobasidium vineae]
MSTIRPVPSSNDPSPTTPSSHTTYRPSTPSPSRSHTSTPTTIATLTPEGHHRAVPASRSKAREPVPLHPYQRCCQPKDGGEQGEQGQVPGSQNWIEVKRVWWKRVWSCIWG